MNEKPNSNSNENGDRFQNILSSLSKCKIVSNNENFFYCVLICFWYCNCFILNEQEFLNEKEECEKLREINSKLELQLRETRELERSHRYHLTTSREMIGNLQETVSHLVYLKRDIKKVKDEMAAKNAVISAVETVQWIDTYFN